MSRSLTIRPPRADELGRVAAFLARLNPEPEHHIGYCGADETEISQALEDDFDEVPVPEAFVLAEHGEQLVGVLGFGAGLETGYLELWGPFAVGRDRTAVADRLWNALTLPPEAARLELFCNAKNVLCIDFAFRHGFMEGARAQILGAVPGTETESSSGLEARDFGAFVALHDALFPDTYYSGATILKRLGSHRQVFAERGASGLCAYAYAEVAPEFGEGSLEFVGVAPVARGRGLGAKLVRSALAWTFSLGVREVTLTVSAEDEAAGRLYRRAGFALRHEMRAFRKSLTADEVWSGTV